MTATAFHQVFARRVTRERTLRGWSVREMAARSDVLSHSTICRAEAGREIWLGMALAIAEVLELTLAQMFDPPVCGHCDGKPPAGFSCPDCERLGVS